VFGGICSRWDVQGNHKNLRKISTKLADAFPEFQMLTVTHRAHGKSERGQPPHSVDACAGDLIELLEEKEIFAPDVLIGHSFGGKVALGVLERFAKGSAPHDMLHPRQVWVLDSTPGVWEPERLETRAELSQSVFRVIEALKELPQPLESKNQLVEELTQRGFTIDLAQWMTLNVRADEKGQFRWMFDLDIIQELFQSYGETDFWPLLDGDWLGRQDDVKVDFIRAGRNSAWSTKILTHFENSRNPSQVRLHTIKDVGHWLHVEKPDAVLDLMSPSFAKNY